MRLTPGLQFRDRADGVDAYWICGKKAARSGFKPRSERLWSGSTRSSAPLSELSERCLRLQAEMHEWTNRKYMRRPTKLLTERGHVYFVKSGELVKIGWSSRLIHRLQTIQYSSPVPLQFLGSIEGTRSLEARLQDEFEEHHSHGEWFRSNPRLSDFIKEHASQPATIASELMPLCDRSYENKRRFPLTNKADQLLTNKAG